MCVVVNFPALQVLFDEVLKERLATQPTITDYSEALLAQCPAQAMAEQALLGFSIVALEGLDQLFRSLYFQRLSLLLLVRGATAAFSNLLFKLLDYEPWQISNTLTD